jgi:DNA repair protein RecN (Recombination protein N)
MLQSLTIKNIVLIESLSIDFESDFNALTGETGAGKSILLDSLGLALGRRAELSLIRHGTDQGSVSASFFLPANHSVMAVLKEHEIEADQNLLLRRTLSADGRSRAFINDQPVSIALLKDVGFLLVEIHGQFDTHGFMDMKTHRVMLDGYAGIDVAGLRGKWNAWKSADKELESARAQIEKARADDKYLRQALSDLDALAPQVGEEETLATLRARLMKREQVIEALNVTQGTLDEAETLVGNAQRSLSCLDEGDAALTEALERVSVEMQEVFTQMRNVSHDYEHSEFSLEEIDDRLFSLRGQARKHDCTVDELPQMRETLAERLNMIEAQDDILIALTKKAQDTKEFYIGAAQKCRDMRLKTASKLDKLVALELPPLKLEKARFVTKVEALDCESEWGPYGMDRVMFVVATNPGAEPGPLNKIASGGELARFILALKVVMAEVGAAGTLIFDEVDTGIGGSTAAAVGARLATLSQSRQILVVTHAPQVAAKASQHFIVMKSGQDDVRTTIIPLSEMDARQEEIARMLSGAEITLEARAAADKLLEKTGT